MAGFLPGPGPFLGLPEHVIDGSGQPAGVWLPAETYPASRSRVLCSVRGRSTFVPASQEAPMGSQRPRTLPRDLHYLAVRGRRTLVVPAQANPPYPWTQRQPAGRRWVPTARGHRFTATPAQDPVWPNRPSPARTRLTMLRRGSRTWPTAPQSNPPYPWPYRSPAARRLTPAARGRQWTTLQSQAVILTIWPPPRTAHAGAKLTALRHGTRTFAVPAQQNPPYVRPGTVHPAARLAALRRGARSWPTPAQSNPPFIRANRQPAGRRYSVPQRGRGSSAAWFVVPASVPSPPCITPPTQATILAYTAKASVTAYTSGAKVSAYTSSARIAAYLSAATLAAYSPGAGIVAQSSDAGLILYTSTAALGPKYCF